MSARVTCPKCARPLPADAPRGVCPDCLLGLLAPAPSPDETQVQPQAQNRETASSHGLHRFGDYELVEEIARGGMGVVYKARQLSLNRVVAVKMILAGRFAGKQFVQRFRTEAATAAILQHPNIVAVHDVGVQEGQHFFSMDYVQGQNLAQLVGNRPLPPQKAAHYLKPIAEAIHYAHGQGILHRDLKPSNVLIDAATDQPRVTDFGLAKRLAGTRSTASHSSSNEEIQDAVERVTTESLTLTGQLLGSPNFMPPEQAGSSSGKVGRHSDVYSLGGILYYLLTARAPFQADSLEAIVTQVLHADPVSLRLLNSAVPRDLETICLKCLEKDPARRYATAQALAEELDRFLDGEPVRARPLGPVGKVWRWCRRRPALATALLLLHVVLALGLAGILWQWQRATQSERVLRQNVYAADVNLAQVALEAGNLGRASELLQRHRPAKPSTVNAQPATDLRGFEWRYLWKFCQGDETATLRGHKGIVTCVIFSPDGKLLASGSDETVTVWDCSSWKVMTNLGGLSGPVCRLALSFSPDRTLLAAAGGTNLMVWDTASWRMLQRLEATSFPLGGGTYQVTFSPDGQTLATTINGDLRLWNTVSWQPETVIKSVSDTDRNLLAFSPNGKMLATFSANRIQFWDVESRSKIGESTDKIDRPYRFTFLPTGKLLAAAESTGKIKLIDVTTKATVRSAEAHAGFIQGLTFSPNGKWLATGGADQLIHLWNLESLEKIQTLKGHQSEVWAVAFSPDGQTLASASKDGTVKLWPVEPKPAPPNILEKTNVPLWFSPDGRRLVTWHERSLHLWDIPTGQQQNIIGPFREAAPRYSTAISADGQVLATGLADGRVQIWDLEKKICTATNTVDANPVFAMAFSQDDRWLALATGQYVRGQWQGGTKVLDLATGRLESLASDFSGLRTTSCLAFSPDGKFLAGAGPNYTVRLWDLSTRRRRSILRGHVWHVRGLAFSPDGKLLASAGDDGIARLWDVVSGAELARLSGHKSGLIDVVFSPDGKTFATTSNDKTAKLWSVGTYRELLTLKVSTDYPRALFSPDGRTLATGGIGDIVQLWRAPSFEEIDAAENTSMPGSSPR